MLLTLGELAARPAGSAETTFHFVLNNTVVSDNRIPPWGMGYDAALERNIRPVPPTQYGAPGPGGVYRHFDVFRLDPPAAAARAEVELLYQSTAWEYVQFLELANSGANTFLANVGRDLLDAWLATGMSPPVVVATAEWVRAVAVPGGPIPMTGLPKRL